MQLFFSIGYIDLRGAARRRIEEQELDDSRIDCNCYSSRIHARYDTRTAEHPDWTNALRVPWEMIHVTNSMSHSYLKLIPLRTSPSGQYECPRSGGSAVHRHQTGGRRPGEPTDGGWNARWL